MPDREPRTWPRASSFLGEQRYTLLLLALLLMFFYGPIVELFTPRLKPVFARVTIGMVFTLVLIAAVFAVTRNRRTFWSLLLAVPAIAFEALDLVLLRTETLVVGHLLLVIFLGYIILVLLKSIFLSQRVTMDTILASLCVYLLLGTQWAMAYSVVTVFDRDAFSYALVDPEPEHTLRIGKGTPGLEFYYSFVTMTTLGYGDVIPATPIARSLATLQAVVGQLYLAVLVARLVGLHVAESARGR